VHPLCFLFFLFSSSFVCASNILGMAVCCERICATFTGKTCLVPRSDEFECQGQRLRSPGTKNALGTPAAAVDGTILSLPGVISGACMLFMFGKTSLAVLLFFCYFWLWLPIVYSKMHLQYF